MLQRAVAKPRSPGIGVDRNEVNRVVKSLRDHGIEIRVLHNHMLNDQPRLFFMHFCANDELERPYPLGLRAALDMMKFGLNNGQRAPPGSPRTRIVHCACCVTGGWSGAMSGRHVR
ncbi:MAG TPA: DUF1259 domain-containing protein [Casimicrobiaceae bacterium]|nr:DUF1259 domain-containing protein [Casimicrobiaceae bacterium]